MSRMRPYISGQPGRIEVIGLNNAINDCLYNFCKSWNTLEEVIEVRDGRVTSAQARTDLPSEQIAKREIV